MIGKENTERRDMTITCLSTDATAGIVRSMNTSTSDGAKSGGCGLANEYSAVRRWLFRASRTFARVSVR